MVLMSQTHIEGVLFTGVLKEVSDKFGQCMGVVVTILHAPLQFPAGQSGKLHGTH